MVLKISPISRFLKGNGNKIFFDLYIWKCSQIFITVYSLIKSLCTTTSGRPSSFSHPPSPLPPVLEWVLMVPISHHPLWSLFPNFHMCHETSQFFSLKRWSIFPPILVLSVAMWFVLPNRMSEDWCWQRITKHHVCFCFFSCPYTNVMRMCLN